MLKIIKEVKYCPTPQEEGWERVAGIQSSAYPACS